MIIITEIPCLQVEKVAIELKEDPQNSQALKATPFHCEQGKHGHIDIKKKEER